MKLNNHSHVHVRIRQLCLQLELLSGIKLETDLNREFVQIRFSNHLSYIHIDYEKEAVFSFSHKITKEELETIKDIMLYCNWVEIGNRTEYNMILNNRRKS